MALRITEANLAADQELAKWCEAHIIPQMIGIRDNRGGMERRWERYWRIWLAKLDRSSYAGRTKMYLAAGRRVQETIAKRLKSSFFASSGDLFSVLPVEGVSDDEMAAAMYSLQKHFIEKTLKLRQSFMPLARQLAVIGNSPYKIGWMETERQIKALKRHRDAGGDVSLKLVMETVRTAGPTLRVVPAFDAYVYPETADDVEDLLFHFEDKEVRKSDVRELGKRLLDAQEEARGHFYENVDLALKYDSLPPGFKEQRERRLKDQGITQDPARRWNGIPKQNIVLSEGYWEGEVRPEDPPVDPVTGEKLDGSRRWLVAFCADTVCVRLSINPFYKQTIPYDWLRSLRVPDEFYGHAAAEAFDRVQYFLNDIGNQFGDAAQIAANPIAVIDPNRHTRPNTFRWLPRAKWYAPLDAIRFDRPPDVTDTSLRAINFLQSAMNDYGGIPSILQGQPPPKGQGRVAQSSEGLNLLATTGSGDIDELSDEVDIRLGEKLLQRNAELIEQFMTWDIYLKVLGPQAGVYERKKVTAADVIGDYVYKWLGVSANRQQMQLAQGMTRFMEMLIRIPPQPGLTIEFATLIKKVWSDVFGQHGADQIVKTWESHVIISPELEHDLLEQGRDIKVQPAENHLEHLRTHLELGVRKFAGKPELLGLLRDHVMQTYAALQQQIQQQQMLAAQAQQQMMMGGGGMPPQIGGPPGANGAQGAPGAPGGPRPMMKPPGQPGPPAAAAPPPPAGGNPGDLARALQPGA